MTLEISYPKDPETLEKSGQFLHLHTLEFGLQCDLISPQGLSFLAGFYDLMVCSECHMNLVNSKICEKSISIIRTLMLLMW